MTKLRIEHGASRIRWVQLKTNIEEPISTDIDRLCEFSENERRYVINELLRFALTQHEDFQKHKAQGEANSDTKSASPKPKPIPATNRPSLEAAAKPAPGANSSATQS
jgi:hypothetical protein